MWSFTCHYLCSFLILSFLLQCDAMRCHSIKMCYVPTFVHEVRKNSRSFTLFFFFFFCVIENGITVKWKWRMTFYCINFIICLLFFIFDKVEKEEQTHTKFRLKFMFWKIISWIIMNYYYEALPVEQVHNDADCANAKVYGSSRRNVGHYFGMI